MKRALAASLVGLLALFVGCSQPSSNAPAPSDKQERVSVPAHVPAYDVARVWHCPVGNQDALCINAYTGATSGDDLEPITRELWAKHEAENAVLVTFYPPQQPGADMSGAGYAFSDRRAARAVIASEYTPSAHADISGQVEQAMNNDGILIFSMADLKQSVCAEASVECTGY